MKADALFGRADGDLSWFQLGTTLEDNRQHTVFDNGVRGRRIDGIVQFHSSIKFACRIGKQFDGPLGNGDGPLAGDLQFAVASFEVGPGELATTGLEAVMSELRPQDALGWLESSSLGVLLRDTSLSEARERVADLAIALDPANPPDCTVYAFPPPGVAGQES